MDGVTQAVGVTVSNWSEMLIADPGLAEIDQLLLKLKGRIKRGYDRWRAYEVVKSLLKDRVGFLSGPDAVLRDERSYILGIRHIEKALGL